MIQRRESMMLCHNFDMIKHGHRVNDWYCSSKLDGFRCFWDSGITRGIPATEVPWANTAKHSRYQKPIVCSGLWSRYYQPIAAPSWFLDMLPPYPLDGELYAGLGGFQDVMSICKKLEANSDEWKRITYCIFDIPTISDFLKPGKINVPNFTKVIDEGCWEWAKERMARVGTLGKRPSVYYFDDIVQYLENDFRKYINLVPIHQEKIRDIFDIEKELEEIDRIGGEGLVIRSPTSHWTPERSHEILKIKKLKDSEGICIGYIGGKETDKGSKLMGMMGAMIIQWGDIRFELSGFNEKEREMVYLEDGRRSDAGKSAEDLVRKLAGERLPHNMVTNRMFPLGTLISFKYSDLSNDGIPRFARYWRKSS